MWIILVGIIAAAIAMSTIYEERWGNPVSSVNIDKMAAIDTAENIINYATLAKQYAVFNNVLDTAIANSDISNFSTYSLSLMGDYRVAIINYKNNKYELVSWDIIKNKKTQPELVINSLAELLNTQRSKTANTNVAPLLIINNACNADIVNSYIGNIYKNKDGYQTLFNDICTTYRPSNFTVGKYNLLIQVME